MKSRTLTLISAITLFAALALPVRLAAQHTRYKLVDIGTFGGSESYINPASAPGTPADQLTQVTVTTYRNDNTRQGLNASETILKLANVNPSQFGKLFSQSVDGFVFAQPLYLAQVKIPGKNVHNVLYVATQHDSVYAFDADNNTGINQNPLWKRSFIDRSSGVSTILSEDVTCRDTYPEIGITGTPTIDSATGTLYVVVRTKEQEKSFVQRLHALDVSTGEEKFGGPVEIEASVPGTGDGSSAGRVAFEPLRNHQRPGLLLQNGYVYISWASQCDIGPYHGWVMAYDAHTLQQVAIWNATPNGGLGGVWQAGGAPAADTDGNVFLATGNGTFDADTGGVDFGDSLLKFGTRPARGQLPVLDYFTPYNQADMSAQDADFGSGGPMLLPTQPPGSPHRNLMVMGDKTGTIYLVDRDNLGKFNADGNQIVQTLAGELLCCTGGTTAWWNNIVYVTSVFDTVKAFRFDPATGLLSSAPVSQTVQSFQYPPPFLSVSSNGQGDAIVWALDVDTYNHRSNSTGQPAVLRAFDARDLSRELYNSNRMFARDMAGKAVKFTVPTVVNGKVYIGTQDEITVYGLLH
ncbi:MAG: pyrrolo-quinoline quinone [Acidobacteria bacterium]|nr:MAG: pyrrolo-quinoline quinone [Acidobacteriota bacterium]